MAHLRPASGDTADQHRAIATRSDLVMIVPHLTSTTTYKTATALHLYFTFSSQPVYLPPYTLD